MNRKGKSIGLRIRASPSGNFATLRTARAESESDFKIDVTNLLSFLTKEIPFCLPLLVRFFNKALSFKIIPILLPKLTPIYCTKRDAALRASSPTQEMQQ